MEFRTLRAFVEVVRQGGFSHAAKTVFATQSTVSKAVKQLEDELGAPLFDRIGHKVRLTAVGEVVYPRAVRLLAERSDLLAELEELRGLTHGSLRLGLPPVGSSRIFAPTVARYRNAYPKIDVHLVEHGGDRLADLVRAGELELAATIYPEESEFQLQDVRREPLVALLARDHPLAGAGAVDLGALKDEPFLLFAEGFAISRMIMDGCRRHGFEPVIAARSSEVAFLIELAAAGLGIAFLPRLLAEQADPRVRAVLLDEPNTEWRLAMIWRRGAFLSYAARAWLDLLRSAEAAPTIPKATRT